jgi:hypothetical protein
MSPLSISQSLQRWRVPLGFLVAALYFLFAQPTGSSIAEGGGIALMGVLWRAWASGTIRKNASLAEGGPYAWSRNPLYFGSFLIAAGFGLASHQLAVLFGIVVFFLAVYYPVMKREEHHLRDLFPDSFDGYAKKVPLFLPWKGPVGSGRGESFAWSQYWRHREYNALLGFCGAVASLFLVKYLRGH